MKQNLIIRASAGTGKTFSLATRFLRLMLFQGVTPERIVALTFSRAAAQEIYMKLLERLWTAALTEKGAAAERDVLLAGLSEAERVLVAHRVSDWSTKVFAEVLTKVVAAQHQGAIATLDSFILRVVRSFPLEFGFQHAVDVLDGYGEKRALDEAQKALLDGADETGAFAAAFRSVTGGEFVRTCTKALGQALQGWRDFLLAHPECGAWTPEGLCRALGVEPRPVRPATDILPATDRRGDPFAAVVQALENFTGTEHVFPKNKGGELMRHLFAHPQENDYTYSTSAGAVRTIACMPEVAARIREIVGYLLAVKIGRAAQLVCAKIRLCQMIEAEYDGTTRRRGLLTFRDFTGCQALAERDSDQALRLENLQFRFDARFDHWALDEFQDTSELQWLCLRRLVYEAAQPDANRSVMAVGDLKQSIYTWRGGNDAPFMEMMNKWDEFRGEQGEIVPNDVSYRYEKHTADFINRVFGPGNVRDGGVLPPESDPAVRRWLSEDCWMEHRPDVRDGVEKAGDFVAVYAVAPASGGDAAPDGADGEDDSGGAALKVLAPKLCACVADLWQRHEAAGSTDTVGILVRNNKDGVALAERLRNWGAQGLPVVWEGADGVLDAPIVRAVLELLKLAEHPEDTFAWKTVDRLFPVREIVFPSVTRVGAVSREVAKMLTRLGLARTLREIVRRILDSGFRPDARSVLRLEALVREGVNYERRKDPSAGLLRFIDYLAASSGREVSNSPHVIRILTIHRSKGLTLDHVIVPILETGRTDTIVKPRRGTPLAGKGWALDALPEDETLSVGSLAEAWRAAANERVLEQLRLNYVALTRARKSTQVFVCADDHEGRCQFRDLLLRPFADEPREESPFGLRVCALGTFPSFGVKRATVAERTAWNHRAGRSDVVRRTPSAIGGAPRGAPAAQALGALFADSRQSAAERGIEAHARYAAIGWIDPAAPKDETEARIVRSAWAPAFVRSPDVTALWRERDYELFANGVWETGRFDRVVFAGSGSSRTATIYDFKTNARGAGEAEESFAARLREQYAPQMEGYRQALVRLTGLPPERIAACLLLAATGGVENVFKVQL